MFTGKFKPYEAPISLSVADPFTQSEYCSLYLIEVSDGGRKAYAKVMKE